MFAIRAGHTFDGEDFRSGGATALVDEGGIVGVEPVAYEPPSDCELLDYGDATVLPWIVASGPPITTRGGHCGYLGGEVSGADEIVAAVRGRVERRVDVVKVMASGGMVTTGTDVFAPQFSIEELRLLVEQAHAAGLP